MNYHRSQPLKISDSNTPSNDSVGGNNYHYSIPGGNAHSIYEPGFYNGVRLLNPVLHINGVSVEPTLRYKMDSSGSLVPWQYGGTLVITGSGNQITFNVGSPLTGSGNDALLFNGGQFLQTADNTMGAITTEDFVFECVFKTSAANPAIQRFVCKRPSGNGYFAATTSNGTAIAFQVVGPGGSPAPTATVSANAWHHALFFYDASGLAGWYINGAASGTPLDVSAVGSLANASAFFAIGSDTTGGVNPATGMQIAYVAMWKRASWLDTHLQASVAAARYAALGSPF